MREFTFEEVVQESDVAVVAEYIETIEQEAYLEHRFSVKDCLYGGVTNSEIYLYAPYGNAAVSGHSWRFDADVYEENMEYLLVTYLKKSPLYVHDRYSISTDVLLCETTGKYTLYGEPIAVPDGMTMREYVCSLHAEQIQEINADAEETEYENEVAEMVGSSRYVGIIHIEAMKNEGVFHNGDVFFCTVESLIKGEELNTYDDGIFMLTLIKGSVEVGKSYIIGFSPATDEYSLIYRQQTDASVYEVSDALLEEIAGYVTQ